MRVWKFCAVIALGALAFGSPNSTGVSVAGAPVDPCLSDIEVVGNPYLFICPLGDGVGDLRLTVRDIANTVVGGIPASDICLFPCQQLCFCRPNCGAAAPGIMPDSPTNALGQTMFGLIRPAGGCQEFVRIVVQGVAIEGAACDGDGCVRVKIRSADINGDCYVNLLDLSIFAGSFGAGAYEPCCDLNCDGLIGLVDLSFFASHFLHECV